jgi:putative glutamine amidotransferase
MPADSSSAPSPLIVVAVGDPQVAENPTFAALKNSLYAEGIRRHGGTPVLLHSAVPVDERERLLRAMDGLLLSGGADLEPALYGQTPQGAAGVDPLRDELEQAAWLEADRRAVPVLGICRGLQAINVFLGGSLLPDVPSHAGTPYGRGTAHVHPIEIDGETILGRTLSGASRNGASGHGASGHGALGGGASGGGASGGGASGDVASPTPDAAGRIALTVNTFHHQAVSEDLLASGLKPSAWADSESGRLVEGFEGTGDRWLVAVQCHPERVDSTPDAFEHLWEAFVHAAREFAARPVTGSATGSISRPD